jgi:TPP-dependent indolepyruvate ferredoxin oxidoreductase alpha subunit
VISPSCASSVQKAIATASQISSLNGWPVALKVNQDNSGSKLDIKHNSYRRHPNLPRSMAFFSAKYAHIVDGAAGGCWR